MSLAETIARRIFEAYLGAGITTSASQGETAAAEVKVTRDEMQSLFACELGYAPNRA